MNPSIAGAGWRRSVGLPLAVSLALGGCGSDRHGGRFAPWPSNLPIAYAYVSSAASRPGDAGAIYEYGIMSDHSLSPLVPASIRAGVNPTTVLVLGNTYVYVVNVGDGTLSQYVIGSDSTLSPLSPATVTNPGMHTVGTTGGAAAVDFSGNYLYVANTADGMVSQFAIAREGGLVPLTPATVATGVNPVAIVAANAGVYVVNAGAPGGTGSVSQFSESADGTLVPAAGTPVAAGTNPSAMAIDAAVSTAYVMSNCDGSQCQGSIRQFSVGADGALTDTGVIVTTGAHQYAVSLTLADSADAYLLTNEMGVDTESGALWHFKVTSTGALTAASSAPISLGAVAVAQAQTPLIDSLNILSTNSGTNANSPTTGGGLLAYGVGTTGALTLAATTPLAAPYPAGIGFDVPLPP